MSDIDFAHILLVQILLGRYYAHTLRHLLNAHQCLKDLHVPQWQVIETGHWIDLLVLEGMTETQERARTALWLLRENGYVGENQREGC